MDIIVPGGLDSITFYVLRPPLSEWDECLDDNNGNPHRSEPFTAWFAWN